MKARIFSLVCLLFLVSPASAQLVPTWQNAVSADGKAAQQLIQSDPAHAELVRYINATYKFPRRVPLVYTEAGKINAWYQGSTHSITVSYDLVVFLRKFFRAKGVPDPDQRTRETVAFILLHEMGHALIHELDLPAVGREEDAADEFASLMAGRALGDRGKNMAFTAAQWFGLMGRGVFKMEDLAFWDEHSLNSQRFYKILCMIYGSNPAGTEEIVKPLVPLTRMMTAKKRFPEKVQRWDRLLSTHLLNGRALPLHPVLPDPANPRQISFQNEVKSGGLMAVSELARIQQFQSVLGWLNQSYAPPKHLYAKYMSTDVPKNFFLPMTGNIILSKQFFDSADSRLSHLKSAEKFETMKALETFSVLQEFSRGMIEDANLPITGEPEDAAAELAMLMVIRNPEYRKLAEPLGRWYKVLGDSKENVLQLNYWSESAMDQQRYYDLLGYLHVAYPQEFPHLARLFSPKRLAKMRYEYQSKRRNWWRLLQPFGTPL